MKLTKKLVKEISNTYRLGNVKEINLIKEGNISHNFIFRTNTGNYIVRVLGYKLDSYWAKQKEREFKVLEHLIKKKFPYNVPNFLKNKKGRYISKFDKKLIEAYPRIKGRRLIKLRREHVKEIAKALAIYHKTIASLTLPKKFKRLDDYKWIKKQLQEISKVEPKNDLDRLMLKNVHNYLNALTRNKKNFRESLLVGHHDFHKSNLLFNNNKLTGILDFENAAYSPKIRDFFFSPGNLQHNFLFLKEYMKYNKITKTELNNLVTQKLLGNCYAFWWAYKGKMKNEKARMKHLKHMSWKYERYIEFEKMLLKRKVY